VEQSLGYRVEAPESVKELYGKPTRCEIMDADIHKVREFLIEQIG